jgi:hypothetical protein
MCTLLIIVGLMIVAVLFSRRFAEIEEQSQEIPAETHEGNEAYRDEPDISVRIVCIPKHGTRG